MYVVSTSDDGPGRAVAIQGTVPEFRELPEALSILDRHGATRTRDVLVDVGANIGTTALPAVLRHGFERVLAIEPEPENVRVLAASAALNGVGDRVEIVAAAASDQRGEAMFHRGRETKNGWRAGAGSLLGQGDADGRAVTLTTVDSELEDRGLAPSAVGLLWIDVQGHEGHVLQGAASLVERSTPVVFAVRPKKLAKAGRLDALIELVQAHYAHVVDLREPGAEALPSSSLAELVARTGTTDVLAFSAP